MYFERCNPLIFLGQAQFAEVLVYEPNVPCAAPRALRRIADVPEGHVRRKAI
jgi:hypothetical protein